MTEFSVPKRQATMLSVVGEEAVPTEDPRNTTELLAERLNAWKGAVDYLDEYFSATERMERAQAKEYEKILKTIQSPLKSGHHFDQSVGGVASLFENMRQNTQGLINTHLDSEKRIKETVVPIMEQLRKEIKNKTKEVAAGALKGIKEIEKARNLTQRHIELLGQNSAGFDASGCRLISNEDPYVLRRGVLHRLSKQLFEENNHRHDLVSLQENFCQFEQHVLEVIQTSMASLHQVIAAQSQRKQELYGDMLGTAQAIPADFEWNGFISRSGDILVNPDAPDRKMENISFPNQDHKSARPVIDGFLERKSRNKLSFSGFSTGYYVVTPSKFLHEFKDDDFVRRDPVPELSIFLPDASIGLPNGEKFSVKGKDVSNSIGSKLSGTPDIQFKAPSAFEAQKWFKILQGANSSVTYNSATNDFSEVVIPKISESAKPTITEQEKQSASPPPTYREESPEATVEKKPESSEEKRPEPLPTNEIPGDSATNAKDNLTISSDKSES